MIASVSKSTRGDFTFTVEQLFNPLMGFEREDDGDSSSSCICTSCTACQIELSLRVSDCEQCQDSSIHCRKCGSETCRSQNQQRRVQFAESQDIITIPSHRDYTDEEVDNIWASPDEIEENANRNRLEYKYEGHWRMVLEEEQFILCSDGKLYHPVTVGLYLRHLEHQKARARRDEAERLAERKRKSHLEESVCDAKKAKTCSVVPESHNGRITKSRFHNSFFVASGSIFPRFADTAIPRLTACVAA